MVLSTRTHLTIDALISVVVGAVLFFAPDKIGDFVFNSTTDGVHWHLIRCVGGQIMAAAFFFYKFRERPEETHSTCFILRVTAAMFALLLAFNSRSTNPGLISELYLKVSIYINIGIIVIAILQLIRLKFVIGGTLFKDHVGGNFLFQLDSLASIVIGMAWLACPEWLLHRQVKVTLDASHALCARVMGTLFVAGNVVSAHTLHWKHQQDRSTAAESRMVCCLFILSAQIWSQIAYERDWSGAHWVGISLFSTWTVIATVYRTYIYFAIGDDGKKKTK
uniref:Cytochrome b561 domain-containing protein n=1 Tax=Panagrellus redivivus TaxID=6233 RepID=A0A7E4VK72_PANRE